MRSFALGCCKRALRLRVAELNGPFVDGMEIPCHVCGDYWRFENGQWAYIDHLRETIDRMVAELPGVKERIETEAAARVKRERG